MKRNLTLAGILILTMTIVGASVFAKDFRRKSKDGPLAAIMDFENKSGWGSWQLGRAASDVLSTELVKKTSLRCMEREKLESIMKEKNLSASGLTTPDTFVKMGGMLGVKYIITGAISSLTEKQIGGSGFGVYAKLRTYRCTIDLRIIDAATGEIIFADTAEAEKKSPKLSVKGVGGGEDYNSEAAAKILRAVCGKMAKKIEDAME